MAPKKSGACSSRRTCGTTLATVDGLRVDVADREPLPNEKRMFRSKIVVKQVLGLCHKPNEAKRHQQMLHDENKNQACALAQTESGHCEVDGGAAEFPQISGRDCGHDAWMDLGETMVDTEAARIPLCGRQHAYQCLRVNAQSVPRSQRIVQPPNSPVGGSCHCSRPRSNPSGHSGFLGEKLPDRQHTLLDLSAA